MFLFRSLDLGVRPGFSHTYSGESPRSRKRTEDGWPYPVRDLTLGNFGLVDSSATSLIPVSSADGKDHGYGSRTTTRSFSSSTVSIRFVNQMEVCPSPMLPSLASMSHYIHRKPGTQRGRVGFRDVSMMKDIGLSYGPVRRRRTEDALRRTGELDRTETRKTKEHAQDSARLAFCLVRVGSALVRGGSASSQDRVGSGGSFFAKNRPSPFLRYEKTG